MFQGRAAWAEVDLDAIAHNVGALKAHVGSQTKLLAVVKANAYGHGALPVAHTALAAGADWLGVNTCDEGVQLRQAGVVAPILLLGFTPARQAATIVAHRLTPTVNTLDVAEALSAAAGGDPLPVHVKVDSGLTRFGMLPEEIVPFVQRLNQLPGLRFEGLFTHFANADSGDKSSVRQQVAVYEKTLTRLAQAGIAVPMRHVAASGATLDLPETHLDMVRCGIAVYGLYPSDDVSRAVVLRPALSVKARLARVRTLPPGTGIGYGWTYTTQRAARVALVPLGYADGVKRTYSNRGQVLLHGRRAPVVGRVSMDQLSVDVTDIPQAREGDDVVLIGRQGDDAISAEEMADVMNTINYEVVVGFSARLPRVYRRNSREAGYTSLIEDRL